MPINQDIVLYKDKDGDVELQVNVKEETVWLTGQQMASLFKIDRTGVVRHVQNIFKSGELKRKSTCAKIAQVDKDGRKRKMDIYNLDVIISVGYRANSKNATQFRIWATNVLKQHLIKGYTVNQPRLKHADASELNDLVKLIKQSMSTKQLTADESAGLLKVITDYADTWLMLDQYDKDSLSVPSKQKSSHYVLEYGEAQSIINALKKNLLRQKRASELFGQERENALKGILGAIEQTFDGKSLYGSVEEKAAHLLYFLTKDHPFTDGNKRIAAFLFIVYLTRTQYLNGRDGERKFNDNALVALVLLIAQSDPKQKDLMMKLVMNFVNGS